MELKTARLTVLLDPTRKREFEHVCREHDMTPSQVIRRLIRDYMESAGNAASVTRAVRASGTAKLVKAAQASRPAPAKSPARRRASGG